MPALLFAATLIASRLAASSARNRRNAFRDKVAIVTGGSRGLGLLLTRELLRRGAKVAICERGKHDLMHAYRILRQDFPQSELQIHQCDVGNNDQVQQFVKNVHRRFGKIHFLFNNAGIIKVAPILSSNLTTYDEALDVMFRGTLHMTYACLPHLLDSRPSHIVNITSIGAQIAIPHLAAYNCAKFAQIGFSESLAAELAEKRIAVTTVVPATMRTGSHVNARFGGQSAKEYRWFRFTATTPLVSVNADRAAATIIHGVQDRKPMIYIGYKAAVIARLHSLFPSTTTRLLAAANRLLPDEPSHETWFKSGAELEVLKAAVD
jgi:short-subunit dehydrogenase